MCGLFGFLNYSGAGIKDLKKLTNALAEQSAVRGTDATGVAFNGNGGMCVLKDSKSALQVNFKHSDYVRALIGHTRHSTQGSEKKNYNNHPFPGKCRNGKFALAHNGVLYNDKDLKKELLLPKTKIETDSYVAVQLLEKKKELSFDGLRYMAEKVKGSFSFSIVDERNNIYLVKGDSPLSIIRFPNLKLIVYASTDKILYRAITETDLILELKKGAFEEVKISCGDILKLCADGRIETDRFTYSEYFGRDWWGYGSISDGSAFMMDDTMSGGYIDDLKSIASYHGYSSAEIDELLAQGFSPFEIEEFLYEF